MTQKSIQMVNTDSFLEKNQRKHQDPDKGDKKLGGFESRLPGDRTKPLVRIEGRDMSDKACHPAICVFRSLDTFFEGTAGRYKGVWQE